MLGGEPLAKQNMQDICKLCKEIKDKFPEKKIWLYSGYQYESLSREQFKVLLFVDVLVDGRYDEKISFLVTVQIIIGISLKVLMIN